MPLAPIVPRIPAPHSSRLHRLPKPNAIGSIPPAFSMRILKPLLETEEEVVLWIDQRAPGFAGCWSFIQNVFFIIAAYVSHPVGFFTFLGGFWLRFRR
jgi:hypothetical protein